MARWHYFIKEGDETGDSIVPTQNPEYWGNGDGYVKVSKAKGEALRKDYCKRQLLSMLKPGDTVYCILRHESRSGMRREISLRIVDDGDMRQIDAYAADLMGYRQGKSGGLIVDGCGMDMGFHLVYTLGRYLWPDGFKLTESQHGRNGNTSGFDKDGGYALMHSWL